VDVTNWSRDDHSDAIVVNDDRAGMTAAAPAAMAATTVQHAADEPADKA